MQRRAAGRIAADDGQEVVLDEPHRPGRLFQGLEEERLQRRASGRVCPAASRRASRALTIQGGGASISRASAIDVAQHRLVGGRADGEPGDLGPDIGVGATDGDRPHRRLPISRPGGEAVSCRRPRPRSSRRAGASAAAAEPSGQPQPPAPSVQAAPRVGEERRLGGHAVEVAARRPAASAAAPP
jgi:hypothetical protein